MLVFRFFLRLVTSFFGLFHAFVQLQKVESGAEELSACQQKLQSAETELQERRAAVTAVERELSGLREAEKRKEKELEDVRQSSQRSLHSLQEAQDRAAAEVFAAKLLLLPRGLLCRRVSLDCPPSRHLVSLKKLFGSSKKKKQSSMKLRLRKLPPQKECRVR